MAGREVNRARQPAEKFVSGLRFCRPAQSFTSTGEGTPGYEPRRSRQMD